MFEHKILLALTSMAEKCLKMDLLKSLKQTKSTDNSWNQAYFFNVLAKTQLRKNPQFLPSAKKLKAIFVQKLKVGAAFI